MTTETADPVAAALEKVRDDIEGYGAAKMSRVLEKHAPALLAAVEAVLKVAVEQETKARGLWEQIAAENAGGPRAGHMACTASAYESAGQAIREAISRELLTGEECDGH